MWTKVPVKAGLMALIGHESCHPADHQVEQVSRPLPAEYLLTYKYRVISADLPRSATSVQVIMRFDNAAACHSEKSCALEGRPALIKVGPGTVNKVDADFTASSEVSFNL